MTTPRIRYLRTTIGLLAALVCCLTHAADTQAPPSTPATSSLSGEPPPVEPDGPLALEDALALALLGNPELEVFSWETRIAEARAVQARKFRNPELELRLYRLRNPDTSTDPEETRRRVILSQDFELGGKRHRRADLELTERDLAGWDYQQKRAEVAATVSASFYSVLAAQRRVASWDRFVEFVGELRDRVAALVESGVVRSVEAHQLRRQLGLARLELQRAQAELATARFRLAATWGGRAPRFTEAVGELERLPDLPDFDTLVELAQLSPAIARWDAELARGEAALAVAKAERVPDLRVGVGVRWDDDFGNRDYLLDLELPLPLADRKQGEIREAQHEMARAQAGRRAAEAASSERIADAYYRLADSAARASTLDEEILPAAGATFEAFRLGFENDPRNAGDLLDARRDLARAEAEHADALVDFREAFAELEALVGRSLDDSAAPPDGASK